MAKEPEPERERERKDGISALNIPLSSFFPNIFIVGRRRRDDEVNSTSSLDALPSSPSLTLAEVSELWGCDVWRLCDDFYYSLNYDDDDKKNVPRTRSPSRTAGLVEEPRAVDGWLMAQNKNEKFSFFGRKHALRL
jgi:hypothetical protein